MDFPESTTFPFQKASSSDSVPWPSVRESVRSDPYWAGGLQNRTPPSSLLACLDGFVADAVTGACSHSISSVD